MTNDGIAAKSAIPMSNAVPVAIDRPSSVNNDVMTVNEDKSHDRTLLFVTRVDTSATTTGMMTASKIWTTTAQSSVKATTGVFVTTAKY